MLHKQDVAQFARGLLIGSADIVPGVSGGTVALIVGIYTRLVTAISRVDGKTLRLVLEGKWSEAFERIDGRFLIGLVLGILTAILTVSSLIHFLLENKREGTFAAFFGMILGSSILVIRMVEDWTWLRGAGVAVGAMGAYFFVGLPQFQNPPQFEPWYLFICGAFAICAMILPGVSGSFLLLILGAYSQALTLLSRLKSFSVSTNDMLCIIALGSGIVIGIVSFTKVLRWLLAHYEAITLAVLGGFMIGSLRRLWPFTLDLTPDLPFDKKQLQPIVPDFSAMSTWTSLALLVAGCLLILVMDWVATRKAEFGPVPPSPDEAEHPLETHVH